MNELKGKFTKKKKWLGLQLLPFNAFLFYCTCSTKRARDLIHLPPTPVKIKPLNDGRDQSTHSHVPSCLAITTTRYSQYFLALLQGKQPVNVCFVLFMDLYFLKH
ncbi:hypothetical protein KIL84_010524 [Mauremys mutica]|uniref:Uncharacterized protein n=1 Tax=Mauremys mutica TaxID=74926 RepID=A0A9D3XC30_9SAUR|nr:hypothetical protein KIL84_010524 [Mauremys mutica]